MDLIDREQAIAEMHLAFGSKPAVHAQAINALNSLPSAEKTGRWEIIDKGHYFYDWKCSVCGGSGRGDYLFCPNCGTRMVE